MKNYLKASKWLRWIAAGAFSLILILNIMVSLEFDMDNTIPSITLIDLGNKAMAQASVEPDCPGGSCSYTTFGIDGKPRDKCDACCPIGKSPKCDSWGCICE